MHKSFKIAMIFSIIIGSIAFAGCSSNKDKNEKDKEGRFKLSLRNLYFNEWSGGDSYTAYIEDKFNVSITPSNYSWASWDEQVYSPANGNSLTDVFHFSLDSYNFENSYKYWAKGGVIKALPDDMSKYPNLKKLIDSATNIESLKLDGHIYCVPIIKDISQSNIEYSPFTYVYRRDWAKELNVYQENDVYTWDQFLDLLDVFYEQKCKDNSGFAALADVEWGYPSLTNFYKDYPHIFALDENGRVVNNYATEKYIQGLDLARSYSCGSKLYYGLSQYTANDGDINEKYVANRVGVFYENLSLANYTTLRTNLMKTNKTFTAEQLDDATAIMKVKGPDGKYVLEGTENWFSATFFNADMSDEKMDAVLSIMEWTLGEEGTMMATYGMEGHDYNIVNGKVVLTEDGWEKDKDGKYVAKYNGAKYLRYMSTLSYDTNENDPLVDQHALSILNDWYSEMDTALANNQLRILKEDNRIDWAMTPIKLKNAGKMLEDANSSVMKYCYGANTGRNYSKEDYLASFNTTTWNTCLAELNELLGNE